MIVSVLQSGDIDLCSLIANCLPKCANCVPVPPDETSMDYYSSSGSGYQEDLYNWVTGNGMWKYWLDQTSEWMTNYFAPCAVPAQATQDLAAAYTTLQDMYNNYSKQTLTNDLWLQYVKEMKQKVPMANQDTYWSQYDDYKENCSASSSSGTEVSGTEATA
jgi:hypothetical protein